MDPWGCTGPRPLNPDLPFSLTCLSFLSKEENYRSISLMFIDAKVSKPDSTCINPPRPSGIHPRNARMVQHPQFNHRDTSQPQFPELPHGSAGLAGQTGPRQPTGATSPGL